ncbi:uncharacterized protein PRCAT00006157001 [Priceomyces carsonii]|uniref:uncharacterized protein n=1 Tax=Priceomyces carsonii TaxID=28549 RepID=UPI002ED88F9E|nr:unnamed protein product [Priceomyces carsonii]
MSIFKYQFQLCIGKGNFGDVYKATEVSSKALVAVKVINLDETNEDIQVLIQEIQFLSRLHSPYITKYIETFISDMSMFIVMEYCGGGSCADLLKFCKKLPEDVVAYIIRDVLRGLNYLHQEKKVHRDIKSANILLTEKGEIKLADFGVSGEITMTQLKRNTFVGTPFWMAPEVITRRKSGGYNEKADIWSTGITTIELVTGSPPLSQYDPMKILFEIPKNKPPILTGYDFSENIKDFVKYCLLKDPRKRPSSAKLLHHRFITSVKSSINLAKIISQKNEWFELHNKASKKPRHDIFSKPDKTNSIKWDFNTFKSFHSSKMQQTLVNLYKDVSPYFDENSNESLGSPLSDSSPNPMADDSQVALKSIANSPMSSPLDPYVDLEGRKSIKPYHQKAHQQNTPHPQVTAKGTLEESPGSPGNRSVHPSNGHRVSKGEILFYCLEQVYIRGRSDTTKRTVHSLINNLLEYEMNQPGLSEAIVEEVLQFGSPHV